MRFHRRPTYSWGLSDHVSVVVPSTGGPAVTATQLNGSCGQSQWQYYRDRFGRRPTLGSMVSNGGACFPSGVFNNLGLAVMR